MVEKEKKKTKRECSLKVIERYVKKTDKRTTVERMSSEGKGALEGK